jgi:signal transduction histidine kinase
VAHDPSHRSVDQPPPEETAADLYDHAPCGYLSTLPDGTIAKVNQTLVEWTGYSRDTLLAGTKLQQLLTIGSRIYYETHHAPLLQMQGFANEIALDVVCAGGRILPVIVNSLQRRDHNGAALFNRITLFESTDRKRYERELLLARRKAEHVAKDRADLLAMLSHDIRNPLNALMGVVHLLDRSELNDRQRRYVQLLKSSSKGMLELLDRVLELSKAESLGFAVEETGFAPRQVVGDVISTFSTTADQKQLELRCTIDDRVPAMVLGDPIALRQVLTNLVGNAIKFTETGGVTITVNAGEVAANAATLDFAVADTGIGIPPDRLDQIFEEYTQASDDTSTRFGGSGLGLAISRKLLAFYGSKVHVVSAPGKGSTFSFSLRLTLPPAPA